MQVHARRDSPFGLSGVMSRSHTCLLIEPPGHHLEPMVLLERLHLPPVHQHATQHWLQMVGTSLGHFVTDLSEIATSTILSNVSFGLRHGRRPGWPLRHWAEQETHPVVARSLTATVNLYDSCHRLLHLALDAHMREGLGEFNRRYQEILQLQQDRPRPRWRMPRHGPRRRLDTPPPQALAVIASGRMILEAAAQLAEVEELPNPVPRQLPAIARHTIAPLRSLLPDDPTRAWVTMLYLMDLALMTPVGRYHGLAQTVHRTSDLLPGARLLEAVRTANELDISASTFGEEGQELIAAVCRHLVWPQPGLMAFKSRELIPKHDPHAAQHLLQWQQDTMELRQRQPDLFVLSKAVAPQAEEEVNSFVGRQMKAHLDAQAAPGATDLGAVSHTVSSILEPGSPPLQALCANLWIEGRNRDPAMLLGPLRQAPDLQERVRATFQLLFDRDLDEVQQL